MPEVEGAPAPGAERPEAGHEELPGQTGGAEQAKPQETVVTASTLQSVLSRQNRTYQEDLTKKFEAQQKTFESMLAAKLEEVLAKAAPPSKVEGGKGQPGDNGAAILSLEKKNKELEDLFKASEKARGEIADKEREFRFRTKVEASLARNKCSNTAAAYAVLRDMGVLNFDAEADKITAMVKDTTSGFNLGDVPVDIDTYIKGTFKEEVLPQLFEGVVRPGAPASGESAGGPANGKWKYTQSQLENMSHEQYVKERDRIEEARRTNSIRMGA
jgi:hypothetical protein